MFPFQVKILRKTVRACVCACACVLPLTAAFIEPKQAATE